MQIESFLPFDIPTTHVLHISFNSTHKSILMKQRLSCYLIRIKKNKHSPTHIFCEMSCQSTLLIECLTETLMECLFVRMRMIMSKNLDWHQLHCIACKLINPFSLIYHSPFEFEKRLLFNILFRTRYIHTIFKPDFPNGRKFRRISHVIFFHLSALFSKCHFFLLKLLSCSELFVQKYSKCKYIKLL